MMTLSSGARPSGDDAQAIDDRSKRHVLRPGDILGVDYHHELAHLLDPDGGVRAREARSWAVQPPSEHARTCRA